MTELTYDNIRYMSPDSGVWVHFVIKPDMHGRTNLGDSPLYRQTGHIQMLVMSGENTGTKGIYEVVDTLLLNMSDMDVVVGSGNVHTYKASMNNRGVVEGWQTMVVEVQYKHDTGS